MTPKMDWSIHYVFDAVGPGGIINAHTHGMEHYQHPDFQVVLNFPPEHIAYLLNSMSLQVQRGERFTAGTFVNGIYLDCPIRLDQFRETGRELLRLIIPDRHNRFPEDPACEPKYKVQLFHAFEE